MNQAIEANLVPMVVEQTAVVKEHLIYTPAVKRPSHLFGRSN